MRRYCFYCYIGDKFYQFKEFRIYLSNTSDAFGQPIYQHFTVSEDYIIPVRVNNTMARLMKINRDGKVLTICEVKIYEGGEKTLEFIFEAIKPANLVDL